MKIVHKKNTTVIVAVGNKKYTRLQSDTKKEGGIVWKNTKTNSLVNTERFRILENDFLRVHGTISSLRKVITPPTILKARQPISSTTSKANNAILSTIKSDTKALELDAQITPYIETKQLLAAVKIYKEATNLGLKESKDYVDSLNEIHRASILPLKDTAPLLNATSKSFDKNSDRKTFITNQKSINRLYGELVCLREMSNKKGWTTVASKIFYDNFIK